jgi:propanediol dehydratase large subunit
MAKRQKRFEVLDAREVNKDGFVTEWPEVGLIAMGSPNDPQPSIKVANGVITEMDGKKREEFDFNELFIANYAINTAVAEQMMAIPCVEIARKIVDINVPRAEVVKVFSGLTPAKIAAVMDELNVVEMMMGIQKMRARRTPGNQAHVTNMQDNPVLMAADAAEATYYGFDEIETTVAVFNYGPMNALALLVGGQVGRPGAFSQDALEESIELQLGLRGLTAYAETVSVYGTEKVFVDGDDTPWSKGFLASAYASRGLKMRFTSGTGSEVQMAYAEGKSMLYLEIKCVMITKAAGVQGLQNGSISCIGVPGGVPGGIRAVLAENLVTTCMDLEVASGNDQTFSHSPFRRTARLMGQFLPGTDFIFSGYSAVPNYDNMFAGSNFDSDDYDDFLILQRDLKVDGGLRPVREAEIIEVRHKAAKAIQAVFAELGLPAITDAEVEDATYAHGSKTCRSGTRCKTPRRRRKCLKRGVTGVDVVKALAKRGFPECGRSGSEHPEAARFWRLSAHVGDSGQGFQRGSGDQRPERLPGSGHRLPFAGRTLGTVSQHPSRDES